jgi:hypothetical protein
MPGRARNDVKQAKTELDPVTGRPYRPEVLDRLAELAEPATCAYVGRCVGHQTGNRGPCRWQVEDEQTISLFRKELE